LQQPQQPLPARCNQVCAVSRLPAGRPGHSSVLLGSPHTRNCAPTPTAPLWGR
jgi:hypothetical protein